MGRWIHFSLLKELPEKYQGHLGGAVITKYDLSRFLIKQTLSNSFKPIFWLRLSLLKMRGLSH